MSKSRKRNNIIIIGLILVYVLAYALFIFKDFIKYIKIINCVFISLVAVASYFMYGFQQCSINKIRKKIIIEVAVAVLLYFIIIYTLGIFTGYLKNIYSLRFISIIKNGLPPLISVIAIELFRYIFVSSNRDSKKTIVLATIVITLFDMAMNYYKIDHTLVALFIYFTVKALPIIFKNIVLSYLTYQVGYHSCLIYVIPLCIYKYTVPAFPNLGNYLTCVINITLPSLIYIYSARMISDNLNGKENYLRIIKVILFDIPLILFFTISIGLISGYFRYHLIGVDTSAISPKINRGDAVMIFKDLKYDEYNENDIIAYKQDDKIIINRISKKEEDENGYIKLYITTEINEGEDDTYQVLSEEQIIGRYNNFKIAKIAFPTIWFKEHIKGDVNETQ